MQDRRYLYDLEFIRSEMELKLHEFKLNRPTFDTSDILNKIEILSGCISHVYNLYEDIEKINKRQFELEFLNKKLIAEISILKTKTT